ncbi:MAG: L-threonylcarbamoyladenylate synthase [Saprospiraceae bacterium]|nr:L-threonylcarbamoyladenylate synthase [Saprospiraceae bacterium]
MTRIGTDISQAVELLTEGEVVAIPTETVYGLAGNGTSTETAARIFEIKNRPRFDPMILHFRDLSAIQSFVIDIPDNGRKLAEALWPGPLTLLLEKTKKVPDLVTSGSPKVAVRVPSHPMLVQVLGALDFPLAAPSANPFGYISPTTAQHVADQLGDQIPYILDGGPCTIGLESTIVDVTGSKAKVLRKGGVTIESIEELVGPVDVEERSTSRPSAPGMLQSHYAPKTKFKLTDRSLKLEGVNVDKVGVLAFQEYWPGVPRENQILLSESGDLYEAARSLFAAMREMDNQGFEIIYSSLVPDKGLGRAINDKLRRASMNV